MAMRVSKGFAVSFVLWLIVCTWLVWNRLDVIPSQGPTFKCDEELLYHLNLVSPREFTAACQEFLLKGASFTEKAATPSPKPDNWELLTQGWSGGEWFYPPEAANPNRSPHGIFPPRSSGSNATFSVSERGSYEWMTQLDVINSELSTKTLIPENVLMGVEGRLLLEKFWDLDLLDWSFEYSIENRNRLKLMLKGVLVDSTDGVQRQCMTGCAYRLDHTYDVDCGFVLKMKYPKSHTLTTRMIEAELSSSRNSKSLRKDPLHFPSFRIIGPDLGTADQYKFMLEDSTLSALHRNVRSRTDAPDGQSVAEPEDLVHYLERAPWRALGPPMMLNELNEIRRQGKVGAGPYSTKYYPPVHHLTPEEIEIGMPPIDETWPEKGRIDVRLTFVDVLARRSNVSGGILVSGMVLLDFDLCERGHRPLGTRERPYSVEGIWNSTTGELCMLGYPVDYPITPDQKMKPGGDHFGWQICVEPIFPKHKTIDSTVDRALMSSLEQDAQGPGFFSPLRFERDGSFPSGYFSHLQPNVMRKLANLSEYRYTVAAKAEELARWGRDVVTRKVAAEMKRESYPAPDDTGDLCDDGKYMAMVLSGGPRLQAQEGDVYTTYDVEISIKYIESCPYLDNSYLRDQGDLYDHHDESKTSSPLPGTYLKVALELAIRDVAKEPIDFFRYLHMQRAEGVYEPYSGEMHLLVHLRPRREIDPVWNAAPVPFMRLQRLGGDTDAEDHEVYMKIQYPPARYLDYADPLVGEAFVTRKQIQITVRSLRSKSDLLYFPSVTLEAIPDSTETYGPEPSPQ